MVCFRHLFRPFVGLAVILAALCVHAAEDGELLTGPAYAKFRLTLTSGWREELAGPFFYKQNVSGQSQWAIPPFFCRTITPEVDWSEWELLYPVINYRRFGKEYRMQIAQVLSWAGGETPGDDSVRHTTLFPIYFHQHTTETNHNYTAVFPFYGHLENRMFRDDIKFLLFPLWSETRKKGKVTDNYLYPFFDRRRGEGISGGEFWPLGGDERKIPTYHTNAFNEVETNGGYDKRFVLWPLYFNSSTGIGTTNPTTSMTFLPAYSQTRSPLRDETSYGFPLGFNAIHDREKGYVEHDFIWPLFVKAHGTKTVTRYFPIYSRAEHNGLESDSYGFILYKYNRLQSAPLDRHRSRVLFFLYSDTVERNIESHDFKRRVDLWPFYSYRRELDGTRRTQVMGILDPLFPNNRTMSREYSPIWSFWRAEKNPHTSATSQSLLWNLYRHEKVGMSKKASLLFGLIQYQSMRDGGHWRLCGLNLGRKAARATAAKT